jgi:hypothetical protein
MKLTELINKLTIYQADTHRWDKGMEKLNSRDAYLIEIALRQMKDGVTGRKELELRALIEKLQRVDIEQV